MIKFKALLEGQEWEWMRARCHMVVCEDSQGVIGYDDEKGSIRCGAVFDNFTVDSCSVHLAIDNPTVLRHGFLEELARHLFVTCGRARIFAVVPSNNSRALKLNLHIGWKEVGRIPDAISKDIDGVVLRMDKEDCRYLPQEVKQGVAA